MANDIISHALPEPVAVTGSSGGVGSAVINELLEHSDVQVLALARDPARVVSRPNPGLAIKHADYADKDSLDAALDGVGSLIFVSSDGDADIMRRHHENVVESAASSGVEYVIYTSIIDIAADSSFYYTPVHRYTEALLRETGIPLLVVRTSIFAEFFTRTWILPALDTGALALPIADSRLSLVTRNDVAATTAAAFLDHRVGIIDATGSQALSGHEIAAAVSIATRTEFEFQMISEETYRGTLEERGEDAWLIEAFTTMFRSVREGRFAKTSDAVAFLTGTPPETFVELLGHREL